MVRIQIIRNLNDQQLPPKLNAVYVYTKIDDGWNDPPCHFVCEGVDYHTSMRWARTYFLNNFIKNYMKNIEYSHKTDPLKGTRFEFIEFDIELLYILYTSLVSSFTEFIRKINSFELKDISAAKSLLFSSLSNSLHVPNLDPSI